MTYLAKTPEGLLPCPHCGGEAEARDGSSTTPYIRCKSCGCRTGSSHDMDKLKEAWNRRAERTCHQVMPPYEPGVEELPVCSACGWRLLLDDGDRYCSHCGAKVVDE